jgi:hypothetical protein
MTWTKIGDEFADEAADLTDAAVRTHIEALLWSNRRLLDLVVPKRDLRRFAFSTIVRVDNPDDDLVIKELVTEGWWEDRGDSWFVGVRWPEWQHDRIQVLRVRERETLKKRRQRAHAHGDHSLCENCGADTSSLRGPDPSRVLGGSPRGLSPRGQVPLARSTD